jgi:hypothetical protein
MRVFQVKIMSSVSPWTAVAVAVDARTKPSGARALPQQDHSRFGALGSTPFRKSSRSV